MISGRVGIAHLSNNNHAQNGITLNNIQSPPESHCIHLADVFIFDGAL